MRKYNKQESRRRDLCIRGRDLVYEYLKMYRKKYMKKNKTNELKLDEFIERKIKEENITLATLSRKTGIPRSSLHFWMCGRQPAGKNFPMLISLSEYFNVSLEEALFNKRDKNATEVLFSSKFKDGNEQYHLMIEKIKDK